MELHRMVLTPGTPSIAVDSGYVTWSSMSCGDRPGQSVKTICWFSPISGMASTETGLRGRLPSSQSNGATYKPAPTSSIRPRATTSLL